MLHRRLNLQHHRHTGRWIHHQHTSYHGLLILLVVAGASMAGLNALNRATADSLLGVTVSVAAPKPSTAASITTPAEGDTVSTAQTVVSGNCPLISPQVVVSVLVDGLAAGSGICGSDATFAIPLNIPAGAHALVARTYTFTGGNGPDSAALQITSTQQIVGGAVSLATDQPVAFLDANRTLDWSGTVIGSASGDKVKVYWGDGTSDIYAATGQVQNFTHRYSSLRAYNMTLASTHTRTSRQLQQIAVAADTTAVPAATSTQTPRGNSYQLLASQKISWLYGFYAATVCVVGVIWYETKHRPRHALQPVPIDTYRR